MAGTAWSDRTIQYSFAVTPAVDSGLVTRYGGYPGFDAALSATEQTLVRQAFQTWTTVAGLQFHEVGDSAGADIRLGWDAIDGAGRVLGQATSWTSGGRMDKAAVQFDTGDLATLWTGSGTPPSGQWSFLSTALHEIGHALGLLHVEDTQAVMYAFANGNTTPNATDIQNLQALYGASSSAGVIALGTGRQVSDGVDSAYYLTAYADIAAAGVSARDHYHLHGWREGRDPNAVFDTSWYLQAYSDVRQAGIDPLEHYVTYGWKEGRSPSAFFSTPLYLASHTDVRDAGIEPMQHYLRFGQTEGRTVTSIPSAQTASASDWPLA